MLRIDIGYEHETIIDFGDIPLVIGKAIRLDMVGDRPYARISVYGEGQKEKRYRLHRYIMGMPEGKVIDHINGDTLDNRRVNLRICSQQENACNSKKRRRGGTRRNGHRMAFCEKVGLASEPNALSGAFQKMYREQETA